MPNNFQAGISKAWRHGPDVNPAYQELASITVAVIPATPENPETKPRPRWLPKTSRDGSCPPLRDMRFFSFEELNAVMTEKLAELNDWVMRKYGKWEPFQFWDRPELKALSPTDYELSTWKKVRVNLDYHIKVDRHYYSVPYTLAHKTVDVRFTRQHGGSLPREPACGLAP